MQASDSVFSQIVSLPMPVKFECRAARRPFAAIKRDRDIRHRIAVLVQNTAADDGTRNHMHDLILDLLPCTNGKRYAHVIAIFSMGFKVASAFHHEPIAPWLDGCDLVMSLSVAGRGIVAALFLVFADEFDD